MKQQHLLMDGVKKPRSLFNDTLMQNTFPATGPHTKKDTPLGLDICQHGVEGANGMWVSFWFFLATIESGTLRNTHTHFGASPAPRWCLGQRRKNHSRHSNVMHSWPRLPPDLVIKSAVWESEPPMFGHIQLWLVAFCLEFRKKTSKQKPSIPDMELSSIWGI